MVAVTRYGPDMPPPMKEGDVLTVDFTLDGQPYTALNGGPQFTFNESISFQIVCKDQEESDRFYDRLLEGGEESMCGWLKDKFGVSWQVFPEELIQLTTDSDPSADALATLRRRADTAGVGDRVRGLQGDGDLLHEVLPAAGNETGTDTG